MTDLIKTPMYGGDIELAFDPDKHQYFVNGDRDSYVPGVTSIMRQKSKPGLVWWASGLATTHMKKKIKPGKAYNEVELSKIFEQAKREHADQSAHAAAIGSTVHEYIEADAKGEKADEPVHPDARRAVAAYKKFKEKYKPEYGMVEAMVYSKEHNYAGTLDCTAFIKDKTYLIDWKTSAQLYEDYWCEIAARVKALQEMGYATEYTMMLVNVGKDGMTQVKTSDEVDKYFDVFLACKTIHDTFERD